jgi:diguanylate cyclase (GGDEF)-like protein/PAS domain S-box-containing protein
MSLTRPPSPKPRRDSAAPIDLARRAALFESVMANAKDAVLVTEAEPIDAAHGGPRIIYVNEAFTAMTGYTLSEAVGSTPRMLQSPRTDRDELDRLRRALEAWESVEVELLNVRKDGTEFWVQFIIVPVTDEAGWFTHWVSIQREVTQRRRRVDELNAMVRGTSEVVILADADGTIQACSPAAQTTLGDTGAGLVGVTVTDFVAPEHRQAAGEALRSLRGPGSAEAGGEVLLRTPSGWRWFDAVARWAPIDNTRTATVITATDATERRRVRLALRQARQRFHGAFADAPIGMAVHARDGSLLQVNAQLTRLLGRSEDELLTMSLDDLVHPDDRRASREERQEVIDGTIPIGRRETRLLHADGRTVGVMLSSSIVRREADAVELVIHVEDISERKALEARLTHQAMHDGLTRLPNRALFLDRLGIALQRAKRSHGPVSVLFLDLNDFKTINDTYGHEVGDEVLATTAKRLGGVVRPGDTAARFGGDEFTVLCEGVGTEEARLIAKRIVEVLMAPIALPEQAQMQIHASIGIAVALPEQAMTADELLRDADMAMYAAKSSDDDVKAFDDGLRSRTLARANHARELSNAIEREELELYFQPFEPLGVGDAPLPMEFEALLRWHHPQRGLLLPATFIPLAEESGLITTLDEWVLRRACEDAATVLAEGATVWVNMSLASLSRPQLVERVQKSLAQAGVAATSLGVELTERALGGGGAQMRATADRLRALGIKLAVDDFGTGYSSLSSVIERPVDRLKIDRSLTNALPDLRSVAVIRAIAAMASALGLDTVAEGVEDEAQLAALRDLGCDRGQGMLLARPMNLSELADYYRGRRGSGPGSSSRRRLAR